MLFSRNLGKRGCCDGEAVCIHKQMKAAEDCIEELRADLRNIRSDCIVAQGGSDVNHRGINWLNGIRMRAEKALNRERKSGVE